MTLPTQDAVAAHLAALTTTIARADACADAAAREGRTAAAGAMRWAVMTARHERDLLQLLYDAEWPTSGRAANPSFPMER